MESVESNKVVEYREINQNISRIFPVQGALPTSTQPTDLGQETEVAMAEAWFCVQLTIFVLI